ncbi:cAMP-dependent protein kinase inhibitor beta isoform X1 [Oryctolagus cuniculus]|uniref:cAMP-dependent protein kinase inhibitor beta n=2 Tax=Oryctolagus cuniculus TaxID=9986 RepID=G1TY30_RABIT|nr:cAMP-dependent protein kinase inhibitor beta isoform X1 [Oryctolagus cuniculus]XP_051711330.1 cAMP-dependent protein kinase inhibitor beta isoform X1 [Oryctolagus cuniculus]XP_051711331.1 cAMP-dependent protein kinase inhibitor beta isoform X1 [Oryctolagus cuniculus]
MDVHPDTLGGKESASSNCKASNNTGNQQGHYPCMNKNDNQDAMLNSPQDVAMKTDSSSMTDVESMVTNFATSARAGRRNALPDIQSSAATAGSSELPLKLADLSVKEDVKKKDEEATQDQLKNPQNEEK